MLTATNHGYTNLCLKKFKPDPSCFGSNSIDAIEAVVHPNELSNNI